MRIPRKFSAKPPVEQEWLLGNTWCAACSAADLGMTNPVGFEEDGRVFLADCRVCGGPIVTQLPERGADI